MTIDVAAVRIGLERCRTRIVASGGGPNVSVLAVTKGFGPEAVLAAGEVGAPAVGENYAQEALAKRDVLVQAAVELHFIGRLQSNKVRRLAEIVGVWESVDRSSLVAEIARRAPGARILVQVNTTGEPDKGGCPARDVATLVQRAKDAGLVVEGLMTVGPTSGSPQDARPGFRIVRALVEELGLSVCSMGMSGDLEVAVEEGSTEVRIGTGLFGPRPISAVSADLRGP